MREGSPSPSYPLLSSRPQGIAIVYARSPQRLLLPIASSAHAQRVGLSERESLGPSEGMVFSFPFYASPVFTLEATRVSLDVVFCRTVSASDRAALLEVVRVATVPALSPYPVAPPVPCDVVIELCAGCASELGIAPGSQVTVA